MFSSRLPGGLPPNAITRAADALRHQQIALLDLTETNPTRVGLPYREGLLSPLGADEGREYSPEALGLRSAREAVARSACRPGVAVDPNRVVLTTSTSEAYALLFKLLCNAGDAVLVPQPSYPLFDLLAGLEAVMPAPYRLSYHGRWEIDRDSVARALSSRTRAVLVVTPNNPTGSMLRREDRAWLAALAAERSLAIISDEVFAEYPLRPGADASSFAGEDHALTFVLGGLSKSAGLPQVKLGWMIVNGPEELATTALAQLDVICDTYLSVSTPVQLAAPALLAAAADIRAAIQQRISTNLTSLERKVDPGAAVSVFAPEGGWSVVLRVPATESEEDLVLRLIRDAHVLVHPGYFFDFPSEAFIIVSLLPAPDVFNEGIGRVLAAIPGT
jgi:alanine-synthesizing transaminase